MLHGVGARVQSMDIDIEEADGDEDENMNEDDLEIMENEADEPDWTQMNKIEMMKMMRRNERENKKKDLFFGKMMMKMMDSFDGKGGRKRCKHASDSDDDDVESAHPVGWRRKLGGKNGKISVVVKLVLQKRMRNAPILEQIIKNRNIDINDKNIWSQGYIDVYVPGLLMNLGFGFCDELMRICVVKKELIVIENSVNGFLRELSVDLMVFDEKECYEVIKKIFNDVRLETDIERLNLMERYKDLRKDYLRTDKVAIFNKKKSGYGRASGKVWNGNNNNNRNGFGYGFGAGAGWAGARKPKKPCRDWNRENRCAYVKCKWAHKCSKCGSDQHGAIACPNHG